MEQEKLQSIIESILFVSGEPIKKSKLVKILSGKSKVEDIEKTLAEIQNPDITIQKDNDNS